MKKTLLLALTIAIVSAFSPSLLAQEEARAAWQITKFDINANVQQAERTLAATAVLSANNVGRGTGSSFTFRIANKAAIKSVNVGGAVATFRATAESNGGLQRVVVTLPSTVPMGGSLVVTIVYTLPVESNSGLAAISPVGSQFLPMSFWYPQPNTPFTLRGADMAPFHITVNGANVISSGTESGGSGSSVYDEPMNGQPFFVQGDWEKVETAEKNIAAYLPRGSAPEDKKQAEAIIALTAAARTYFASFLGPVPDLPIRLVAVRRGAGFNDSGTILLETGAFRRSKVDASTALLIGESISRLWLGTQTPVRGEGGGMLREALPRFLATLFIEKQYGQEAARGEFLRERLAYSTVARKDGPLARVTPLDGTYFNSVQNKGAMFWRLLDGAFGRQAFLSMLSEQITAVRGDPTGLTLAKVRNAYATRGGEKVKTLIDQELDQVTDLDLMIGLPQQRGNEWVAALRNVGSIDAYTSARATTATGEQLSVEVLVPARNFAEAVFKTPAKIVRVEVDPDKYYPQLDYSNDTAPKQRDVQDALAEATRLFGAQDYAKAESIARDALALAPNLQEARILYARALLAQNRDDEAAKLFRQAIDDPLPTPASLAWGNIGLGEISLRKGQAAEAAKRFADAVHDDAEYAASLAARAGRIRAETATNTLQVDPAIRTFVGQLDQALLSGKRAEIDSRVVSGELVRFMNGIVGTQPEIWQTKVLRTEQLDANLVAADVSLETKELGVQHSGTAVYVLTRVAGGWKLLAIDFFEVA